MLQYENEISLEIISSPSYNVTFLHLLLSDLNLTSLSFLVCFEEILHILTNVAHVQKTRQKKVLPAVHKGGCAVPSQQRYLKKQCLKFVINSLYCFDWRMHNCMWIRFSFEGSAVVVVESSCSSGIWFHLSAVLTLLVRLKILM